MAEQKFKTLKASDALKQIEDFAEAAGFELCNVGQIVPAYGQGARIPKGNPGMSVHLSVVVPAPLDDSESSATNLS